MKKSIIPIVAALCLLSQVSAYAQEPPQNQADPAPPVSVYQVQEEPPEQNLYPVSVETVQENGVVVLRKTYEAPQDFDPEQLVEPDFEQDGFLFTRRDILRQQLAGTTETRLAYQTVSLACEDGDEKKVLRTLSPLMDYEENGYSGQLQLNADTLIVEADDYDYYQYTVTKEKEFSSLDRNDPVYMEKTTDSGMKLMDVEWSAQAHTQVADSLVPSLYRGNAIYQGIATGRKATGYTTTATYIGELSRTIPGNILYTVVYHGEAIPEPEPEKTPVNPVPIAAAATVSGGGIFYAVFFFFLRRNAKIYNLQDGEYVLLDRQRVKENTPVVDLGCLKHKAVTNGYMIELDKGIAAKLAGKSITIVNGDKRMQRQIDHTGGTYQFEIYL